MEKLKICPENSVQHWHRLMTFAVIYVLKE